MKCWAKRGELSFLLYTNAGTVLYGIYDLSSVEAIAKGSDNSDIIIMSFSDGSKIDFDFDIFCNADADKNGNEVDVVELSTPGPTPGPTPPPDVDLSLMCTDWGMVKHILEKHDQEEEDVIRQLDLLHEQMPEYKYYDNEFFDLPWGFYDLNIFFSFTIYGNFGYFNYSSLLIIYTIL